MNSERKATARLPLEGYAATVDDNPSIVITVTPDRRPGRYRAYVGTEQKLLCVSRQPFLDGARKLLARGHYGRTMLVKLRTALEIDKRAKRDAKAIDDMVIAGTISLNEGKKLATIPDESRSGAITAVKSGSADVRIAVRNAKKDGYNTRVKANNPQPLEGHYRIFYIDPPWKYHGLNQADEYGHAEAHYDCLDDKQLIEFKPDGRRLIKDLAEKNAILFMWVTQLDRRSGCGPGVN
jgi:hypothetical protein